MKNLFLLILIALLPLVSVAQNFPIGSRTITFTDPARNNRAIATEVYYPAVAAGANAAVAEGEFPVIAFGHGFTMTVNAFYNWRDFLVPLGYIVALPTTEGGASPNHGNFGGDLAFLAAKLQADNTNAASPFFGKVRQRAAIMGHSMGGGASFLAAANNTNIQCVIGLAPAETNPEASVAATNVTVPSLILHGTSDNVTPEADHALLIYQGLVNSCRNYVRITNGSHCFFANTNFTCDFGETFVGGPGSLSRTNQHTISYAVTEPYLRYFLFDDCSAYDEFLSEIQTNPGLGTNIYDCPNDAPVITENGGTLSSTTAPNYQWYLDGNEIPGETAQQHTYTGAGDYQVGTINVGTCPVLSNTIVITPTGVAENAPSFALLQHRNTVSLQVNNAYRHVQAEWLDISGRVLAAKVFDEVAQGVQLTLPIPDHTGIKLLRITTPESQRVFKVY
jgi:predicted dienelactone hydrolase